MLPGEAGVRWEWWCSRRCCPEGATLSCSAGLQLCADQKETVLLEVMGLWASLSPDQMPAAGTAEASTLALGNLYLWTVGIFRIIIQGVCSVIFGPALREQTEEFVQLCIKGGLTGAPLQHSYTSLLTLFRIPLTYSIRCELASWCEPKSGYRVVWAGFRWLNNAHPV